MRARFVLPVVVLALSVSGCGGGSSSSAAAQSSAVRASDLAAVAAQNRSPAVAGRQMSASSSGTSTSAGKTAALVDAHGNPIVPAAARAHTDAGAIAFTKYYWALLDYLDKMPQPNALRLVSQADCLSCSTVINHLNQMLRDGTRYSANTTLISGAAVKYNADKTYAVVTFDQVQSKSWLSEPRKKPQNIPSVSLNSAAALRWKNGEWHMVQFASKIK